MSPAFFAPPVVLEEFSLGGECFSRMILPGVWVGVTRLLCGPLTPPLAPTVLPPGFSLNEMPSLGALRTALSTYEMLLSR